MQVIHLDRILALSKMCLNLYYCLVDLFSSTRSINNNLAIIDYYTIQLENIYVYIISPSVLFSFKKVTSERKRVLLACLVAADHWWLAATDQLTPRNKPMANRAPLLLMKKSTRLVLLKLEPKQQPPSIIWASLTTTSALYVTTRAPARKRNTPLRSWLARATHFSRVFNSSNE